MHQADGAKIIRIPIVLALECAPILLDRCRAAAVKRRLLVRACEAALAWRTATSLRPLAILVPSRLFDRAPHRFELLATEAGARLIVLESDQAPAREIAWHLSSAVDEAARARGA